MPLLDAGLIASRASWSGSKDRTAGRHFLRGSLAVFVRFWLTSTPPSPGAALAAARIKRPERYDGFVETLGRLARGRKLADEVSRQLDAGARENAGEPR